MNNKEKRDTYTKAITYLRSYLKTLNASNGLEVKRVIRTIKEIRELKDNI